MNRQRIIAAAAAGTLLAAAGAYGLYRLGVQHGAAPAPAPAAAEKKPLYWHDPMYPAQKFDKPGKSPFMDMQLVPVFGSDGNSDAGVAVSPRMQQSLGVRTAEVTQGKLASVLRAVGSVAYNDRDVHLVQARSAGFIERQYVRAPLDPVRQGQPLLELYVPDWIAAQEEFLAAKRMQGEGMAGVADAARQRMRLAGMSEAQVKQVEATGKVHARLTLTAPASGVVAELAAREGMTVSPGTPLYRINGVATVWVLADIPEAAAAQIRPGVAVEANTPALPGSVFKGKVGAVLPQVDADTRTLKARIELANPAGQLVPGMFATLAFAAAPGADVLLVPAEAVIRTGTRNVVMVAQAGGNFAATDVDIGGAANGMAEIRKGLRLGQKVVVSGQFLIDSEASLKGTATHMGDSPAAAPAHHAEGRVERIAGGKITISHGPVVSLDWGPMTMDFDLPAAGLPRNVATGDTVTFDFVQGSGGGFRISAIAPISAGPGTRQEVKQ
ncbi:RND transporter MFP subunit [Massilia sp. Root418]|uniref:efflux RND transporter periplasmic adaptor subunit n=1 Tax=Massilia sp. Root418 TaxID=1736532 RepID=UPI0006F69DEF|nr:efflux RND transporter periplasmic adaptor subunit [Massilia sp. Root418]KQX01366.1 RND transporter MFP subunit [Massilia sp. Root418]